MELWTWIKEKMMRYPSQEICEPDAKLTYEEMVIMAESLGKTLSGEACCAIYCRSELTAAMALLACFAADVTAVPLSVRYGSVHCKKILNSVSPTCVITDVDGRFGIYNIIDSEYTPPEEQISLIMHTSGTSGIPKGAMLGAESIIANVRDISSYFKIDRTDTVLIARPLYHCAVLTGEFLTALTKGCRIVFSSEAFNPVGLLDLIKEQKITVFGGTPTLLGILSDFIRKPEALSLRSVVVSGECLSSAIGQKVRRAFPDASIYHVYGLTEACPRVCYLPPEHFDECPDCVGIPLNSVEVKIVDADGLPVSPGDTGILWVRGKNVMHGYYNAPDLTSKVLKDGWLCTGDCACITSRGWIQIKGRNDDLIIRAGMNIYPQEIQSELKKDPRTKEVLVYGYSNGKQGTQIALKIVGDFSHVNEVRALCVKILPSYQVPTKVEIVESLPKNGTGKVIRVKNNA